LHHRQIEVSLTGFTVPSSALLTIFYSSTSDKACGRH